MRQRLSETLQAVATDALEQRARPVEALADDAEQVARACHAMAIRFHRGGKLVCFGSGGASTDAQHIAVEFVHPVIVGKRALPAISLTGDVATLTGIAGRDGYPEMFAYQLRYLATPEDIALGVSVDGRDPAVMRGLETAADLGMLTIALLGGDGGEMARSPAVHHPLVARSDDPLVVKEVHVTAYHVLWELVHVLFEQPGVLGPEVIR
jgi:D-sedoheptulose 7-phosphate isomerase